jgi:hypothetical protein
LHLGKIHRAVMFMDLHRVSPAQRNLGTIFAAEIGEIPLPANRAPRSGRGGADFRLVIGP